MNTTPSPDAIAGCLLGTAVGDALGLPAEGLPPARLRRLFPDGTRHRFLAGRGMVSDDTEHACMVAQALIASAGDPQRFARHLAGELKRWLLAVPAGAGLATLRATLRLLGGIGPDRSGVFSAGNGPAMRAPLLGVCFGADPERLRQLVRASTRLTHTNPKAETGALAVALAAYLASRHEAVAPERYLRELRCLLGSVDEAPELVERIEKAAAGAERGESPAEFAAAMGWERRGVGGYIYETVPAVLQCWFRHGRDFRTVVPAMIAAGGDTDTTAAILGGIVGAGVGTAGIPAEWIDGLREWPRSVAWMERLTSRLADVIARGEPQPPLPVPFPAVALRNLLFLGAVLYHGLRRLLPPY
jgi:ADP-ribosylglycohydrolase